MSTKDTPRAYEISILGDTVLALVEVSGRWVPQTRDNQEEEPDTTIVNAWRVLTDEETGGTTEVEISPRLLAGDESNAIIFQALEADREHLAQKDEGHDVFERGMRDKYPERR